MRHWVLAFLCCALSAEDWPCFRGPGRQGVSTENGIPAIWTTSENILWKAAVPGEAWSSPIVSNGRLFLTTATEGSASCRVLAFDARTGRALWDREVFRQTPGQRETKNSYASPTPVADGRRVYTVFGDGSFAALDHEGKVLWINRDFQHFGQHGLGTSPVLHDGLLIMARDGSSTGEDKKLGWQKPWDQSFVLALDAATGKLRWKSGRGLSRIAHVTPTLFDGQLISGAGDVVQGFNPLTGALLWTGRSQGEGVVPSIVAGGGLIYSCSGFEKPTIRAFRPGGEVAWEQTRGVPMIPSLLYAEPYLYSITTNGIAYCYRAATGEVVWQGRVGGDHSASPVLAGGKLYFSSEQGEVTVLEAGPEFKVVARNPMGEKFQASPAISGGVIYLRTESRLYAVGNSPRAAVSNRVSSSR
jgi:outer membrane protein assembly factor BamB